MILHNISSENIDKLEHLFATLTPEGWQVPNWIKLLKETVGQK